MIPHQTPLSARTLGVRNLHEVGRDFETIPVCVKPADRVCRIPLEGVDVELFSMVWSRDNLNSPMEDLAGLARALTRAGRGKL